jgi:hypothetical protein
MQECLAQANALVSTEAEPDGVVCVQTNDDGTVIAKKLTKNYTDSLFKETIGFSLN